MHDFSRRENGGMAMFILILVALLAIIFTGGFQVRQQIQKKKQALANSASSPSTSAPTSTCCDSGNGDACKASTDPAKTFDYGGKTYGLIKSGISLSEGSGHLHNSGKTDPHGDPVILNDTQNLTYECGHGQLDQVFGDTGCVTLPDDEIIYTCRSNCQASSQPVYGGSGDSQTQNSIYDAYFRLSDGQPPDVIRNCSKKTFGAPIGAQPAGPAPTQQIVMEGDYSKQNDLQLRTFKIVQPSPPSTVVPWLSPYCKPAVYLYPTETTDVSVKVTTLAPFTYTNPPYPANGWQVTAYPDGNISYHNAQYDYLYYESSVPDSMVKNAQTGYVVTYDHLSPLFSTMLPKLGLNQKEAQQFSEYWLKALPKSPYYFVGVLPVTTIEKMASLSVSPKPDTVIRVSLFFQPLEYPMSASAPTFSSTKRNGFTVVEWGGLFKKDAKHPFTCLM